MSYMRVLLSTTNVFAHSCRNEAVQQEASQVNRQRSAVLRPRSPSVANSMMQVE